MNYCTIRHGQEGKIFLIIYLGRVKRVDDGLCLPGKSVLMLFDVWMEGRDVDKIITQTHAYLVFLDSRGSITG